MRAYVFTIAVCAIAVTGRSANPSPAGERFWPQWRGPLGTGAAPMADPPITWSETQNVKWKVKLPGSGDSTPIVWENRIFVLSAIPIGKKSSAASPESPARGPNAGEAPPVEPRQPRGGMNSESPDQVYQFAVLCLDRSTGKTLWQKVAREEIPHEGHQQNNTYASASPITDGHLVFAFFGSRGLHCYDFDGNLKWSKDFGRMKTKMGFGEGASPALYGDKLIVNWDHEGDDFIVALDKNTGNEF
jgi:outer membrane protein assembly factor BamB